VRTERSDDEHDHENDRHERRGQSEKLGPLHLFPFSANPCPPPNYYARARNGTRRSGATSRPLSSPALRSAPPVRQA
jgi:hypothetical protein